MNPKFEHFMEEADIGSGEKTPAELADLKETEHLREQQEQARQQQHPMDGALLMQVIEEQQYIAQHESHTPPEDGNTVEKTKKAEKTEKPETDMAASPVPAPAVSAPVHTKKSRRAHARHEAAPPSRAG